MTAGLACMLTTAWLRSVAMSDTLLVFYDHPFVVPNTARAVMIEPNWVVFSDQTPVIVQSGRGYLGVWQNTLTKIVDDEDLAFVGPMPRSTLQDMTNMIGDIRLIGMPTVSPPVRPGVRWDASRNSVPLGQDFVELRAFVSAFDSAERWSFGGISHGEKSVEFNRVRLAPKIRLRMRIWIMPYWLIVIPLTVLSAWLLLSKPHSPKSRNVTEPQA